MAPVQVSNNVRTCNFGKQMVYTASCHPDNPEVAALGCKLGLVLIVSLQASGRVSGDQSEAGIMCDSQSEPFISRCCRGCEVTTRMCTGCAGRRVPG